MSYTRYGIYFVPPAGDLAAFGAAWLGWDVIKGANAVQFSIHDIDDTTVTPRKYGFHGTLKPPFRLATGCDEIGLKHALTDVVKTIAPATCGGLRLSRLGQFLALTPHGDMSGLAKLAGQLVQGLDAFRAPAGPAEIAKRRGAVLTPRQDKNLLAWGYPYVFEEFQFHLTLTGRLDDDKIAHWEQVLAETLPPLPTTFNVTSIALVGERTAGFVEMIQRYDLTG
jgi:hypothetical protein